MVGYLLKSKVCIVAFASLSVVLLAAFPAKANPYKPSKCDRHERSPVDEVKVAINKSREYCTPNLARFEFYEKHFLGTKDQKSITKEAEELVEQTNAIGKRYVDTAKLAKNPNNAEAIAMVQGMLDQMRQKKTELQALEVRNDALQKQVIDDIKRFLPAYPTNTNELQRLRKAILPLRPEMDQLISQRPQMQQHVRNMAAANNPEGLRAAEQALRDFEEKLQKKDTELTNLLKGAEQVNGALLDIAQDKQGYDKVFEHWHKVKHQLRIAQTRIVEADPLTANSPADLESARRNLSAARAVPFSQPEPAPGTVAGESGGKAPEGAGNPALQRTPAQQELYDLMDSKNCKADACKYYRDIAEHTEKGLRDGSTPHRFFYGKDVVEQSIEESRRQAGNNVADSARLLQDEAGLRESRANIQRVLAATRKDYDWLMGQEAVPWDYKRRGEPVPSVWTDGPTALISMRWEPKDHAGAAERFDRMNAEFATLTEAERRIVEKEMNLPTHWDASKLYYMRTATHSATSTGEGLSNHWDTFKGYVYTGVGETVSGFGNWGPSRKVQDGGAFTIAENRLAAWGGEDGYVVKVGEGLARDIRAQTYLATNTYVGDTSSQQYLRELGGLGDPRGGAIVTFDDQLAAYNRSQAELAAHRARIAGGEVFYSNDSSGVTVQLTPEAALAEAQEKHKDQTAKILRLNAPVVAEINTMDATTVQPVAEALKIEDAWWHGTNRWGRQERVETIKETVWGIVGGPIGQWDAEQHAAQKYQLLDVHADHYKTQELREARREAFHDMGNQQVMSNYTGLISAVGGGVVSGAVWKTSFTRIRHLSSGRKWDTFTDVVGHGPTQAAHVPVVEAAPVPGPVAVSRAPETHVEIPDPGPSYRPDSSRPETPGPRGEIPQGPPLERAPEPAPTRLVEGPSNSRVSSGEVPPYGSPTPAARDIPLEPGTRTAAPALKQANALPAPPASGGVASTISSAAPGSKAAVRPASATANSGKALAEASTITKSEERLVANASQAPAKVERPGILVSLRESFSNFVGRGPRNAGTPASTTRDLVPLAGAGARESGAGSRAASSIEEAGQGLAKTSGEKAEVGSRALRAADGADDGKKIAATTPENLDGAAKAVREVDAAGDASKLAARSSSEGAEAADAARVVTKAENSVEETAKGGAKASADTVKTAEAAKEISKEIAAAKKTADQAEETLARMRRAVEASQEAARETVKAGSFEADLAKLNKEGSKPRLWAQRLEELYQIREAMKDPALRAVLEKRGTKLKGFYGLERDIKFWENRLETYYHVPVKYSRIFGEAVAKGLSSDALDAARLRMLREGMVHYPVAKNQIENLTVKISKDLARAAEGDFEKIAANIAQNYKIPKGLAHDVALILKEAREAGQDVSGLASLVARDLAEAVVMQRHAPVIGRTTWENLGLLVTRPVALTSGAARRYVSSPAKSLTNYFRGLKKGEPRSLSSLMFESDMARIARGPQDPIASAFDEIIAARRAEHDAFENPPRGPPGSPPSRAEKLADAPDFQDQVARFLRASAEDSGAVARREDALSKQVLDLMHGAAKPGTDLFAAMRAIGLSNDAARELAKIQKATELPESIAKEIAKLAARDADLARMAESEIAKRALISKKVPVRVLEQLARAASRSDSREFSGKIIAAHSRILAEAVYSGKKGYGDRLADLQLHTSSGLGELISRMAMKIEKAHPQPGPLAATKANPKFDTKELEKLLERAGYRAESIRAMRSQMEKDFDYFSRNISAQRLGRDFWWSAVADGGLQESYARLLLAGAKPDQAEFAKILSKMEEMDPLDFSDYDSVSKTGTRSMHQKIDKVRQQLEAALSQFPDAPRIFVGTGEELKAQKVLGMEGPLPAGVEGRAGRGKYKDASGKEVDAIFVRLHDGIYASGGMANRSVVYHEITHAISFWMQSSMGAWEEKLLSAANEAERAALEKKILEASARSIEIRQEGGIGFITRVKAYQHEGYLPLDEVLAHGETSRAELIETRAVSSKSAGHEALVRSAIGVALGKHSLDRVGVMAEDIAGHVGSAEKAMKAAAGFDYDPKTGKVKIPMGVGASVSMNATLPMNLTQEQARARMAAVLSFTSTELLSGVSRSNAYLSKELDRLHSRVAENKLGRTTGADYASQRHATFRGRPIYRLEHRNAAPAAVRQAVILAEALEENERSERSRILANSPPSKESLPALRAEEEDLARRLFIAREEAKLSPSSPSAEKVKELERRHAAVSAFMLGDQIARRGELGSNIGARRSTVRDFVSGLSKDTFEKYRDTHFGGETFERVMQDPTTRELFQALKRRDYEQLRISANEARGMLANTLETALPEVKGKAHAQKLGIDLVEAQAAATRARVGAKRGEVVIQVLQQRGWSEAQIQACGKQGICDPIWKATAPDALAASGSIAAKEVLFESEMRKAGAAIAAEAKVAAGNVRSTSKYRSDLTEAKRLLDTQTEQLKRDEAILTERLASAAGDSQAGRQLEEVKQAQVILAERQRNVASYVQGSKPSALGSAPSGPILDQLYEASAKFLRSNEAKQLDEIDPSFASARQSVESAPAGAMPAEQTALAARNADAKGVTTLQRIAGELEPSSQETLARAFRNFVANNDPKLAKRIGASEVKAADLEKAAGAEKTMFEATGSASVARNAAQEALGDSTSMALAETLGFVKGTKSQRQVQGVAAAEAESLRAQAKSMASRFERTVASTEAGKEKMAMNGLEAVPGLRADLRAEFASSIALMEASPKAVSDLLGKLTAMAELPEDFENFRLAYLAAAKLKKESAASERPLSRDDAWRAGIKQMLEDSGFSRAELSVQGGLFDRTVACLSF